MAHRTVKGRGGVPVCAAAATSRLAVTRRDAVRLAGLVPAAGLLLAGCQRQAEPVIEIGGEDTGLPSGQDLQEVLDRRAAAQLAGDEGAYLADLDGSNGELIARERIVFANLQQFAPDDVQFLVLPPTGRLVGSRQAMGETAPPSGPFRFAPVIKVVRLPADEGPDGVLGPGESFEYEVVRRDGGWVVTDIVPLTLAVQEQRERELVWSSSQMPPANAPWNLDRLQVVKAGNVWLAGDDTVSDLDRYAAAAESEVKRVEAMWQDRPKFPGHVMFFTRDTQTLGEWFELAADESFDRFAGVALPRPGVATDGRLYQGQYASARMAINLEVTEQYTDDPSSTMRHELVHAVTARATGTGDLLVNPARWALEGFARYFQVRGEPREQDERVLASQAYDGSLPQTSTFYDGDSQTVLGNYALGFSMFRFVEQVAGFEAAVGFYAEVIKYDDGPRFGVAEPFVTKPAFDGICQQVVGMSAPDLLQQWGSFVQQGA